MRPPRQRPPRRRRTARGGRPATPRASSRGTTLASDSAVETRPLVVREALAAALRARLSSIKNRMDMRLDAWPRGRDSDDHDDIVVAFLYHFDFF